MKILALDVGGTAASGGAILVALEALEADARVAATAEIDKPRALGSELIRATDELLREAQWDNLEEVDAFAIGAGPGSWTSLRVGFSALKTWAGTFQKPFVPVPSFDALAAATQRAIHYTLAEDAAFEAEGELEGENGELEIAPHLMLCLAPSHPGAFYGKLFRLEDDFLAVSQSERISSVKDHLDAAFSQALADGIEAPLLLVGAGADDAAQFLRERDEAERFQQLSIPAEAVAVEIALQAAFALASDEVPELAEALPLYLAPSNAERALEIGE